MTMFQQSVSKKHMDMSNSALKIGFFGAAPDTSNMGVSALFSSVVESLSRLMPTARFSVFDNGVGKRQVLHRFTDAKSIEIDQIGVRAGFRYYMPENITTITMASCLGSYGAHINSVIRELDRCDVILDISGGDSFSDIYGVKRFLSVVRPKLITLRREVPLILLPQTYGPYASPKLRSLAVRAVRGADMAWARDPHSFDILKEMLGESFDESRHRSGVDFAFALGMRAAQGHLDRALNATLLREGGNKPVIGLNVSGLIYNDPSAARSQYGFKADYREIVHGFCDWILENTDASLVLIPHVMSTSDHVESDSAAGERAAERIDEKFRDRVHTCPNTLDQNQTKWLISQMDWFCGTRMHSTIAALSSGVAASSVAYSDKTKGVFETCGQGREVFDPRILDTGEVIEKLVQSFLRRDEIKSSLAGFLPQITNRVEQQSADLMSHITNVLNP
ncbi:MAG: hypothetical protein EP348_00240 [Alphaproteobacteria bacterium]|nr:MAG: hypothetical protein EP348_00240 [Alphaproteobacteria bacterium]